MPGTVLKLEDVPQWIDTTLRRALIDGAKKGLYAAALKAVSEIQTSIIPAIQPEPTNRGTYRAAWRAEPDSDGAYYENTSPHAAMLEHGVRPTNVKIGNKLIDALTEWVNMKGIAGGRNPRRVAWAIAISMASTYTSGGVQRAGGGKGIFGSGLGVMKKANDTVLPRAIAEEVAAEIERELTSL